MPSGQILFTSNSSSVPPSGYALVKDPVVASIALGALSFQSNSLIGASRISVSYGSYIWVEDVDYTFDNSTGTITFLNTIVDDEITIQVTPYFT